MKQYLSIGHLKQRYGRFKLLLGWLTFITLCLYCGYWLGSTALAQHQLLAEHQQQRLDELYQVSDKQLEQINFLKVEVEVEKQAGGYVKNQLQELQQENFKLQKALSFYQKVMAPELEAEGISLDSFTIVPSKSKRIFHYKLVLVQTTKLKRFARGFIELKVKGSLDNKIKSYDIKTLVEGFDKKSLQFSFRYFQIIEGDLTLPLDFIPETVLVAAILP
ncbi:MAG: hypothetical protein ACI9FJ_003104, partial [Alteromonadaceae bacterium]